MPSSLTISDLPDQVMEALRAKAEQDRTSIEQAALGALCAGLEAARVDAAWAEEVEARIDSVERGESPLVEGEAVLREIEAEMQRPYRRDEDAA